jgi:hypothetical protein
MQGSERVMNAVRLQQAAWPLIVLALAGSPPAWAAPPPERVALTNGRVIPVVGEPLERGTVLIERGKIVAVGAQLEIPYDARVFDVRQGCLPGHDRRAHAARARHFQRAPPGDAAPRCR